MRRVYRMFLRGAVYYCEHSGTGKQESLQTKDRRQASRIVEAKNRTLEEPMLNLQLARVYATASDPKAATRTWQDVMRDCENTKTGKTQARWQRAMREEPFDHIRHVCLLETRPDHFLHVLKNGTVSTNIFLRRLHNFALDMDWLPKPVLPRRRWPSIRFGDKRGITSQEHQKVLAGEQNPEWQAYYQLLWHLGGSQTDIASLTAEDIDWHDQTLAYARMKTESSSLIHLGPAVMAILKTLPQSGPLFPTLIKWDESWRAKAFSRRCELVGVSGVSLHSYRYAWAERAKSFGYPERFAQQALGHNSKAVHRAYSKKAHMKLPSLEEFETKVVRLEQENSPELSKTPASNRQPATA